MPNQRRSPAYLMRKYRKRNERLRREYLIARLHEWQELGRDPQRIPPIRQPLEGAIATYANHGITQKMYYDCHYRYIEERDTHLDTDEDEGRRVMNYDKVNRVKDMVVDDKTMVQKFLTHIAAEEAAKQPKPPVVIDFNAMEKGK